MSTTSAATASEPLLVDGTATNTVSGTVIVINNNNSSSSSGVRKGRGSQVFTQEMACALVEMYYTRKKDFPGSGYSLPPEAFEAIASELRAKFNVAPNEIDQQTLKKKLSNIRTRVRNRCRDMRPDADISGLNLTPSEKIYFRYFGPPSSGDARAEESGASTPLPNGLSDANNQAAQLSTGREENGHSPGVVLPLENNMPKELSLNELVSHSIIQKYAENLHLFSSQNVSNVKNIEQQRLAVFDAISKHLLVAYHLNMDITQVRARIDEVVRSLAQKMDDFRRISGVNNENIVLRPINLSPAEAELFDAQFTESPEPRKNFTSISSTILLPPSTSIVDTSQKLTPIVSTSVSGSAVSVDGQQQPLVQLSDGFYSVILPSSSNGMPALPEPTNAPSSMLISPPSGNADTQQLTAMATTTASGNLLPPPSVSSSSANVSAPNLLPQSLSITLSTPVTLSQASSSTADPIVQPSTSTTEVPVMKAKKSSRKNNKRKISSNMSNAIDDAEMERRFEETIKAVLSPPNKKTKISVEEKRDALLAIEKQKTLRVQRQLAEEQLVLVRKETKLADDRINFYKVWAEIGNRIRGFLRP